MAQSLIAGEGARHGDTRHACTHCYNCESSLTAAAKDKDIAIAHFKASRKHDDIGALIFGIFCVTHMAGSNPHHKPLPKRLGPLRIMPGIEPGHPYPGPEFGCNLVPPCGREEVPRALTCILACLC